MVKSGVLGIGKDYRSFLEKGNHFVRASPLASPGHAGEWICYKVLIIKCLRTLDFCWKA